MSVIVSDRTLWGWGSSLSFTILSSSGERGIVERTKSDRTAQCGPGWVINLEFQILVKDETDTIYGMEFLIEFSRTSLTGTDLIANVYIDTSHERRRKSPCHSLIGWWTKDRA